MTATALAPAPSAGSDTPQSEPAERDALTIDQRLDALERKVDALTVLVEQLAANAQALADAAGQVTAKLNGGGLMGLLTGGFGR